MKSSDFMDMAQAKLGVNSDNKLALEMQIDRARLSQYRTGTREFPDHVAIKFAEVLELPPGYVLATLKANGAKDSTVKVIWENLAATIKKTHAVAVVAIIGLAAFSADPAHAAALPSTDPSTAQQCILC